jgi:hypothetical protein
MGPARGGARREGENTSRSENETCLVAAGPLGRKPVQALSRLAVMTSSWDPTQMVKKRGSQRRMV